MHILELLFQMFVAIRATRIKRVVVWRSLIAW